MGLRAALDRGLARHAHVREGARFPAKAKEVAEQLDLIVLVAQSNTQAIDWSAVIELDVLMLPHHVLLRKDTSSEAIEELKAPWRSWTTHDARQDIPEKLP